MTLELKRDGLIIKSGFTEVLLVPENSSENKPTIFISCKISDKEDQEYFDEIVQKLTGD